MEISIIIPTYNEAEMIGKLVSFLSQNGGGNIAEIIVADGGSTDHTREVSTKAGAVFYNCPVKGRAAQMNFGATKARGQILYFVHADTLPPCSYVTDIIKAVNKGYHCGRYRTKFNSRDARLKFNEFFTRFNLFVSSGGDQTLFITTILFKEINGFDDSMQIMEDYDITLRLQKKSKYFIFPKAAIISARKYSFNTWWSILRANAVIIKMYKQGASQNEMKMKYTQMLDVE